MNASADPAEPVPVPATLAYHSLPADLDLIDRVQAAAATGFCRLALSSRRLSSWLSAGHELAQLLDLLAESHVVVDQLEALVPLRTEPDPQESDMFAQAVALGLTQLVAVGPMDGTPAEAGLRFRALCDRAADHGLSVSLEFMPWTTLKDLPVAAEVVEVAGRPNGGLCLDPWHLYSTGQSPADVEPYWSAVTVLQLNDGLVQAERKDLFTECTTLRRVPGEGDFALHELLEIAGLRCPDVQIAVEVINTELRALPPAEALARIARGTSAVLRAASWPGLARPATVERQ